MKFGKWIRIHERSRKGEIWIIDKFIDFGKYLTEQIKEFGAYRIRYKWVKEITTRL